MATTLITGANRGIGLELTKLLAERGDTVIAACRSSSKELDALAATKTVRVESGIDVAKPEALSDLVGRVGDTKLDVLLHNAGVLTVESVDDLDMERVRAQIEINALGPLALTHALLPRLGRGSKVAIVTSLMGSIADNGSGGYYGYRMSKAAVNMAGVTLARDLAPKGISVVLLHPGYVRTRMTGNNGSVEPDDAARGLLARIDELTAKTSGRFVHATGKELPW